MVKVCANSDVSSQDGSVVSSCSEKSLEEVVEEVVSAEAVVEETEDEREEREALEWEAQMMKQIAEKKRAIAEKKAKKKEMEKEEKWVLKSEAKEKELKQEYPEYPPLMGKNKVQQESITALQDNYNKLRQYYIDTEFKKWNDNKKSWEAENGFIFNPKKQFTINPAMQIKKSSGQPKIKKEKVARVHKHEGLRGREAEEWAEYNPEKCGCRKFQGGDIIPSQCQKKALPGLGVCSGCWNRYEKSGWFKDGMVGVTGKGMFGGRQDSFAVNHPWNIGDLQDKRDPSVQEKVVIT